MILQRLVHEIGFDQVWALGDPHIFTAAAVDEHGLARVRDLDRVDYPDQLVELP